MESLSVSSSVAPLRPAAGRVELFSAVLYAVWATVAVLADAAGIALLADGAGLVLGLGCALTIAVFFGVARLPVPDQPAVTTLVVAQSLMGMLWAALYAGLAGPGLAGGLFAAAMCLSVVAQASTATSLPVLRRLMLVAWLAGGLATVLRQLWEPGVAVASLVSALFPGLVLAVLLGVIYVAAVTLARARARLQKQNSELLTGIERIKRHAERDHLTNSYSRQFILEMVARERSRADRSGESLCVCLLDIDHFKDMNDRYGHLAGDRILAAFSRRVRGALRTMDTLNGTGLPIDIGGDIGSGGAESAALGRSAFGRVGGEEFIVLLPDTSLRGALRCAERMRKAVVRRPFDGLHQVTVSIGIAEYRVGETVSSLIGRADEALYGAKNAGRNRVHCATADGGASAIVMPDIPAAS